MQPSITFPATQLEEASGALAEAAVRTFNHRTHIALGSDSINTVANQKGDNASELSSVDAINGVARRKTLRTPPGVPGPAPDGEDADGEEDDGEQVRFVEGDDDWNEIFGDMEESCYAKVKRKDAPKFEILVDDFIPEVSNTTL